MDAINDMRCTMVMMMVILLGRAGYTGATIASHTLVTQAQPMKQEERMEPVMVKMSDKVRTESMREATTQLTWKMKHDVSIESTRNSKVGSRTAYDRTSDRNVRGDEWGIWYQEGSKWSDEFHGDEDWQSWDDLVHWTYHPGPVRPWSLLAWAQGRAG